MTPVAARPDPGGVQAAIDRYRDLAKYLITIFAAVGALLLAGTQLASIGRLSWDDAPDRVVAAMAGLLFALVAIAWLVWRALTILRPVEMSLDAVIADDALRVELNGQPSMLGGATSVEHLRNLLSADFLTDGERKPWLALAGEVVDHAAFRTVEKRFETAWRQMLLAALLGAIGIAAFAWGANPPPDASVPPVVRPSPVVVTISLTDDGRTALRELVGATCARGPIRALSIGGTEQRPRVVTLPEGDCKAVQLVLAPEWGALGSTVQAPHG